VSRWYFVVGAIAIVLVAWWWRASGDREPKPSVAARDAGVEQAPAVEPRPELRTPQRQRSIRGAPDRPFDASSQHTADPCTAVVEPSVPIGYESLTVRNVTIAWDPRGVATGAFDAPLRPTSLASLVAGILDEAAQLTGTAPRAELTVVVDPSPDAYRTRTRAPAWSSGVYDGGMVHLFAATGEDLSVAVTTLRHEVMHAQLHAAVGCMPWWFNEGVAQYFAGSPPLREWIAMLRAPDALALEAIQDPVVRDLRVDLVRRAYAWSFAMVLYIVDRAGEPGLRSAAITLAGADSRKTSLELWDKTYPDVGKVQILDLLAMKLFGKPRDAIADTVGGAMCCHGLRDLASIGCRATEPRTTTRHWFEGTAPRAMCENSWTRD
jgi:hypothetical protein